MVGRIGEYIPPALSPGSDLRFYEMYRNRGPNGSRDAEGKADRERLHKACQDFESTFLAYMLKAMRATVPKEGIFGDSRTEEYFTSLLDEKLAEEMARRGGIGLAEILYRDLERDKQGRGNIPR